MEFEGEKLAPGTGSIDDIRKLQKELKDLGHYKKKVDGGYGTGTTDAVKDFQKAQGLPVTGEVDKKTGEAINKAFNALTKKGDAAKAPPDELATLLDQIEKINAMLEKLNAAGKLTEDQKKKYEELEKQKAALLLKALEKALQQLDKLLTWQVGITATREGTVQEGGINKDKTAYGFSANNDKFVALPCAGLKGKWVEIVLADGAKAIAPVGDVGPHYEHDCYWEKGKRPKAETEGETQNPAGIDLSQNLWVQLGLDPKAGMTKLDWRFVDPPADGQVEITTKDGKTIKHTNTGSK